MFKYLISILPVAPLNEEVVKFEPLEDLGECFYRLVVKISLEFVSDESRPTVSFTALDWLAEQWYSLFI